MRKNSLYLFLSFLLLIPATGRAQSDSTERMSELIQFSGLILTPDSLQAVSHVNIRVLGTMNGGISNAQGFFSLVARRKDTLVFTAVGYKSTQYVVPVSLTGQKYTVLQTMSRDTMMLNTIYVKPYISKELFQHYFVNLEVPGEENPLASMDPETLRDMAYAMEMDGSENAQYYLRQESGKYYYTGQMVPINIMNPFAWAQFIKAWKRGDLKIQKE